MNKTNSKIKGLLTLVPFTVDLQPHKLPARDSVHLYFSIANDTVSPVQSIIGVCDIKGGVEERGYDYDSITANLTTTYPAFVANKTKDLIPYAGAHGGNDPTVPTVSNWERNYILAYCQYDTTDKNDKRGAFCLDHRADCKFATDGHYHKPRNGFIWGSKKIYDKLVSLSIPAWLFVEPGGTHDFDMDDASFLYNTFAVFADSVLCRGTFKNDFDSVITFTVNKSSIAFTQCSPPSDIRIRFKLTDNNNRAIISKLDINVKIIDKNNIDFVNPLYSNQVLEMINSNNPGFISAGNTDTFFIKGINLKGGKTINVDSSHTIKLTMQNPNGFTYKSYSCFSCSSSNVIDSLIKNKTGTGCFMRLEQNNSVAAFSIYPNPSTQNFLLSTNVSFGIMEVFDLSGKKLEQFQLKGDDIEFGGQYYSGIYIVKIVSDNYSGFIGKVIKVKE